ncbi:hypothetical protein [Patulibacter minatonensis]|uniref:hypothetical protein n=1 Tax=Patulibacter minatonensis TaxID=298163 RepID=UPI00047E1A31|nr:hypothetical protein [Patulibacter minatonensis]
MASPVQRALSFFGLDRTDPEAHDPRHDRSLLQVLLGNLLFGVVAAVVSKLLGSDAVEAVMFGVIIYVVFLWFDLQARRKRREADAGGRGAGRRR